MFKNILMTIFKKQIKLSHLGRWCHPEYNKKCNLQIQNLKVDLANYDNSLDTKKK